MAGTGRFSDTRRSHQDLAYQHCRFLRCFRGGHITLATDGRARKHLPTECIRPLLSQPSFGAVVSASARCSCQWNWSPVHLGRRGPRCDPTISIGTRNHTLVCCRLLRSDCDNGLGNIVIARQEQEFAERSTSLSPNGRLWQKRGALYIPGGH